MEVVSDDHAHRPLFACFDSYAGDDGTLQNPIALGRGAVSFPSSQHFLSDERLPFGIGSSATA
jgi:hypothetical protein